MEMFHSYVVFPKRFTVAPNWTKRGLCDLAILFILELDRLLEAIVLTVFKNLVIFKAIFIIRKSRGLRKSLSYMGDSQWILPPVSSMTVQSFA